MAQFRFKSDAIRPWLQFLVGPVVSVWIAAAIADSREFSALLVGLAVASLLSGFIYFSARKANDEFLLLALGFICMLVGAGALASIGHKFHFDNFTVDTFFIALSPLVGLVILFNTRLKLRVSESKNNAFNGMYINDPTNPQYHLKQQLLFPELYGGIERDRYLDRRD